MNELMPLITESLSEGRTVEIYPRGVSMRPLIREGKDSVVLCTPEKIRKNDIALYARGDAFVLHRVIGKTKSEGYVLAGDNQYITERGVFDSDVIAVVCAIKRNGREIRTDGFSYRNYLAFIALRRRIRSFCFRAIRKLFRLLGRKR